MANAIKTIPEDFQVEERMPFELTGQGEHLWCWVEKRGMNTAFVKQQWAKLTGARARDISHSGLKDRHAVTRQWLCLPAKYGERLPDRGEYGAEYWQIMKRVHHQRKLRIGTHNANYFHIIVRSVTAPPETIAEQLQRIRQHGVPNYFMEQRFGRDNLERALTWVAQNRLPAKAAERSMTLSTLRAHLFNLELDARRSAECWQQLISGDRALLSGSHSHFAVEEIDETLRARCAAGDIAPAGWLAGAAKSAATGKAGAIRQQVLGAWTEVVAYLQQFAQEDWRALCVFPQELTAQWLDDATLKLTFTLPRGSYATALLAELLPVTDVSVDNGDNKPFRGC